MISQNSPIIPKTFDIKPAVRAAVESIQQFLEVYYAEPLIDQTRSAKSIAGQWLARVKQFHNEDDFEHLVRDFLLYVQSGGERSRLSTQIGYYFSGFMPTYGAACTLIDMADDLRPWSEVEAFMHTLSYGDAKKYVETFSWSGGEQKARAEVKAWLDIIKQEVPTLNAAAAPVMYAQAMPQPTYPPTVTDVPINDPVYQPKPNLRVVPRPPIAPVVGGGAAAEAAAGEGLLATLGGVALMVLAGLVLMAIPGNIGQKNTEDEDMKKWRDAQAKQNKIPVPLDKPKAEAVTNASNNECASQIQKNQKNGGECEDECYSLLESELKYTRLVNPPKGKGLDGLFEKLLPFDQPNPMPEFVKTPKPGKLIFVPTQKKPPKPIYDYTGNPKQSTYPKFVVLEAKHVSKPFNSNDTKGISDEAKRRLNNTCDGMQMGETWTERRIPSAINGKGSQIAEDHRDQKLDEINIFRYARWMFVCLPGPVGDSAIKKIYVLIDVVETGMDLDSTLPKTRKPRKSSKYSAPTETGY